ncbi:MAG: helix-hairpin-helix domain-containing protein [Candidatus Omnitrophica bacterium]|nr:helix-hairpin-helix domain-containing protein [Candidatus Omnitrophota bacterium]MCM8793597.1 helix-hairpin-helix domain-containing protein [Candidatus Omnitrophota bacterium]
MFSRFTKQERKVLVFIFISLFVGILISRYFKTHYFSKEPSLTEEDIPHININSADFSQLMAIPGIGPSLAEAILEYRKRNGAFKNIEQLLKIKGIGPHKLKKISQFIVIE